MTLAREARQRGWWQSYSSNAVPEWFQVYLGLEAEAASIHEYAAELVPGLFQTAEYYRAFMGTAPAAGDEEAIERKIAVRAGRQERLAADDPPECWAVLNEAAIRRVVGGTDVMRAQLQHIVKSPVGRTSTSKCCRSAPERTPLWTDRSSFSAFPSPRPRRGLPGEPDG